MRILLATAVAALAVVLVSPLQARVESGAAASWKSNYFSSPTGNIRCREFPSRGFLACLTLNDHFFVAVAPRGRAFKRRAISDIYFPHGPVLGYGKTWRHPGVYRCRSSFQGMRCTSLESGHGFFINRDMYSVW